MAFISATDEAANKLAVELRDAFARGCEAAGVDFATKGQELVVGEAGWLTSEAVAKNLQVLAARINTWQTLRRGWAMRGRNDDGDRYTWATWADDAKWYRDELRVITKVSLNDSPFEAFKLATAATVETVASGVATAVQPWKWGLGVKIGVGVAVTLVGAWLFRPFLVVLTEKAR